MRRLPFTLLAAVLAGTAIWLGQIIIAYQDYPFFFDEAIHANGGLALTVDLWNGDIQNFFKTFYRQGFYPPAFSVLKGLTFYWLGPSTVVARGFSTVCLICSLIVIHFFGRRVWVDYCPGQKEIGGWVGLIAVLLTLTSLPLLNASVHTMMEAPGLLISFVFLWLYYRTFAVSAIDGTFARPADSDKRGFVLTSFALMAVFLTKYTYGVAMIGTVALMELSMLDWRSVAQLRRMSQLHGVGGGFISSIVGPLRAGFNRWLWLIGPFMICLIIWLGTPFKLGQFFDYATAQPKEAVWSVSELLFYPRNILLQQLPSPLWGLVSLLGLGFAFRERIWPELRLLLIYFLVGMGVMFINFPKIPRFMVTFLPALHLLTAVFLASIFSKRSAATSDQLPVKRPPFTGRRFPIVITQRVMAGLIAVSLIWAIPVLYGRYSTFNMLMSSQLKTAPAVNEIHAWVDDHLPDDEKFLVVNYFELLNMESLAWSMVADGDWPAYPFSTAEPDGLLMQPPSGESIEQFRQKLSASDAEFLLAIEGGNWGASWPSFGEQSHDLLTFITAEEFQVEVINRPEDLLWTTMIDHSVAEHVLENERGVFNLKLILYKIK